MSIDLAYRPRLADLKRLDPVTPRPRPEVEAAIEAGPRITPPAAFTGRQGYSGDFLGAFVVDLPKPGAARAGDVLVIPASSDRLDYQHFSVVMSKSRRLAMLVAVNIDGAQTKRIARGDDKWSLDGRIPIEAQLGERLYADNGLDRGHLVRREDPIWGSEGDAATANEDTFHFTNCAPQMAAFNQRTWLDLEDYVLKNTRRWKERVTVFTGPVFSDRDLPYRGAHIPLAYWKVLAFLDDAGRPSATAYMLDQEQQLSGLEAAFGRYKTYQRSVRRIEELTGLSFGPLAQFDGFSNEEAATGTRIEAVMRSPGDIRL